MVGQLKRATGTFSTHQQADSALNELKNSGFRMDQISVVGNNVDSNSTMSGAHQSDNLNDIDNKAGEGAKKGAVSGGAAGGLTGLLVGLGLVAIPGLGPVMMAGAAATALASTLTGGAIGAAAGGLVGGLIGLGIPEERAKVYSDRVDKGDYLVMVEGTDEEIRRAESIFSRHNINEWGVYDSRN